MHKGMKNKKFKCRWSKY